MEDKMFVLKILLCTIQAVLLVAQLKTNNPWFVVPMLVITAVIWNI